MLLSQASQPFRPSRTSNDLPSVQLGAHNAFRTAIPSSEESTITKSHRQTADQKRSTWKWSRQATTRRRQASHASIGSRTYSYSGAVSASGRRRQFVYARIPRVLRSSGDDESESHEDLPTFRLPVDVTGVYYLRGQNPYATRSTVMAAYNRVSRSVSGAAFDASQASGVSSKNLRGAGVVAEVRYDTKLGVKTLRIRSTAGVRNSMSIPLIV